MPIQPKLIRDHPWFSQITDKISLIRIPIAVIPGLSSGPVNAVPKNFSDADPVEFIPRPSLVHSNRFLKIFLMPIQSKLIQDLLWFSQIADKISLMSIQSKLFQDSCLVQLNRFEDFSDSDPVKVNQRPPLV